MAVRIERACMIKSQWHESLPLRAANNNILTLTILNQSIVLHTEQEEIVKWNSIQERGPTVQLATGTMLV